MAEAIRRRARSPFRHWLSGLLFELAAFAAFIAFLSAVAALLAFLV